MAFQRICALLLLASQWPVGAAPQQTDSGSGGLADRSLEELMNIEVVSVSKKAQRLASTAASVFVITSEDIRRSGISVLPELLRLAPGVQVARLASGAWAIGIRGFNDQYSNKLLVLVDGRSVYSEFYSGVFWDALNVSVDEVDRIEVIRGPGAAMWGTNAVNGVINIITKSAKQTQGLGMTAQGGSAATSGEGVRYGAQAGDAFYRLGTQNAEDAPYSILSSPSPSRGWIRRSADFRLDWDLSASDSLKVSGELYDSSLGMVVPDATITNPNLPPGDSRVTTTGGDVSAAWQHILSDTSSLEVRFSYEHMRRNDPESLADIGAGNFGFQHHLLAGSRNDILWGFSAREDNFHLTPTPALHLNPPATNRDEVALFAEDEISLVPNKLSFIAGAQASHIDTVGYTLQPTGRFLWTPARHLSSWIAVSRAERTPSLVDRGLDYYESPYEIPPSSPSAPPLWAISHVMGSPTVRPETVLAYEAGQRLQPNKRISFDVSGFYNVYRHLVSLSMGVPVLSYTSGMPYLEIPINTGNERYGESYGGDVTANWNVNSRWRLIAGYSWQRVETRSYAGDTTIPQISDAAGTPHHQWDLRSNFDLTRTIQVDTAFYYTSALPQIGIPQHLRGDLRIGWRPRPAIELSIGVQDAFEADHVEFESTRFSQWSDVPRNIYGKVTWRL